MKKTFFLPQWYVENKIEKRKKMIKLCIIAIVVIDIILLDVLVFRLNKVKILENDIKQRITFQKSDSLNKSKEQLNNDRTLEVMAAIIKNIPDNIQFESIYIEDGNVDMKINAETFEYTSFIKEIEKRDEFTIKHLNIPDKKDNEKFTVNMELK